MKVFRRVFYWSFIGMALLFFVATQASAHHEAMFGRESSSVFSPGMFLSAQVFSREWIERRKASRDDDGV